MILLTPKFFGIVEKEDLEGKLCAECQEPFDLTKQDTFAYQSKFDSPFVRKGDLYHPSCINNFVLKREQF